MTRLRTALTALAAGALLAGGLAAAPAQADDVAPVARIACVPAAQASAAWGTTVTLAKATPTYCEYHSNGEYAFGVSVSLGTPEDAKEKLRALWPEDYFSFDDYAVAPVPALGPDAFSFADASPSSYYWTITPGVTAGMGTSFFGSTPSHVATAKLFRPMMEVYTVAGQRTVNGRQWRTRCEKYSQTARCFTDIWATVIKRDGGRYVRTDGWAFNSLTYRWSPRDMWKGNPLGNTNTGWTTADGRKWRTECDTATTGRGACRSYIEATVVSWDGRAYRQEAKWIFNNQVLFS